MHRIITSPAAPAPGYCVKPCLRKPRQTVRLLEYSFLLFRQCPRSAHLECQQAIMGLPEAFGGSTHRTIRFSWFSLTASAQASASMIPVYGFHAPRQIALSGITKSQYPHCSDRIIHPFARQQNNPFQHPRPHIQYRIAWQHHAVLPHLHCIARAASRIVASLVYLNCANSEQRRAHPRHYYLYLPERA